jgi:hypothetical protein
VPVFTEFGPDVVRQAFSKFTATIFATFERLLFAAQILAIPKWGKCGFVLGQRQEAAANIKLSKGISCRIVQVMAASSDF